MSSVYTAADKDEMLRDAFALLKPRGISSAWADADKPYTHLSEECHSLMREIAFRRELGDYLRLRSIIPRTLKMFLTYLSMSANADWTKVSDVLKPLAARGWCLGRWLPTFLIIDGPIGRFLCAPDSPLHSRLGPNYPLLRAARDFLGDRLFKLVRNGFAHWGFDWEVIGTESYVVAYDWERDLPVAKLHQKEADAFHVAALSLVEIIDDVFISQRPL